MKISSIVHLIVAMGTLIFCTLTAQTYTVGDTVDNFETSICANGSGNWEYDTEGLHKVTWINLFTTW